MLTPLGALQAVLRGEASPELHELLRARREREIGYRLGHLLRELQERGSSEAAVLQEMLESADQAAFNRAVAAPELWQRLAHGPRAPHGTWVIAAFRAEAELTAFKGERLATPPTSTVRCAWSALGDHAIGDGWVYCAPELTAGLRIDGHSPSATGPLMQVTGSHDGWTSSQWDQSLAQLRSGWSAMIAHSPSHADIVRCYSRVLVSRRDATTGGFRSCSTPIANGRLVLHNAHLPTASRGAVAEALLHESVHALLDVMELDEPFASSQTGRVIRSPWTGAMLSVRTYVHACWIWYAIAHLWARLTFAEPVDVELRQRSLRGFAGDVLQPLGPYRSSLNPRHAEALAALRTDLAGG